MITASRLPRGGLCRMLLPALALYLCLDSAICQLRPDYSGLTGKYCERRPEDSQCCGDRMDECGVAILGTVCYCDHFCDRGLSGDCCPDYFALCLNETLPSRAKDCVYKGETLPYGKIIIDNCNPCTCAGAADAPEVECGTQTCLVEPQLLDQLEEDADRLGWSAANYSHFWGRTLRSGRLQLLGTDHPDRLTLARTFPISKVLDRTQLPAAFDARHHWSALIGPVQDQGWCGASWALSTAATASDRLSIQTGSRVTLSGQQLLDCAAASAASRGCRGGQLDRAWHHLRWKGVRSAQCRRYRSGRTGRQGRCVRDEWGGGLPRAECRRRYRMQPSYRIASRETDIRHEIFTSGPVQALLRVEPDFFLYRSGVYRTSARGRVRAAYHSVRLVGWGEETTAGGVLPYWVAANSWGTGWGEQGLFRIRRGTNEADIETFVVGSWARTLRRRVIGTPRRTGEDLKSGPTPGGEGKPHSVSDETDNKIDNEPEQSPEVEASGDGQTDDSVLIDDQVTSESDGTNKSVAPGSTLTGPGTMQGPEPPSTDHSVEPEGAKPDALLESGDTDGLLPVEETHAGVSQTSEAAGEPHEESPVTEGPEVEKSTEAVTDAIDALEGNRSDESLDGSTVIPVVTEAVVTDEATSKVEPPSPVSPTAVSGDATESTEELLVDRREHADPVTPSTEPQAASSTTQESAQKEKAWSGVFLQKATGWLWG